MLEYTDLFPWGEKKAQRGWWRPRLWPRRWEQDTIPWPWGELNPRSLVALSPQSTANLYSLTNGENPPTYDALTHTHTPVSQLEHFECEWKHQFLINTCTEGPHVLFSYTDMILGPSGRINIFNLCSSCHHACHSSSDIGPANLHWDTSAAVRPATALGLSCWPSFFSEWMVNI